MSFPKLPDWLIYLVVVAAIVMAAQGRREKADAPPAPPPPKEEEGALLGPSTPFDPTVVVDVPDSPFQPATGTAFAISDQGVWLTARHVVDGCPRVALIVGGARAVAATARVSRAADIAVLTTQGGPVALPLAVTTPLREGQRAFHPGFPRGLPGEVTTRLLGRETLKVIGRGAREEPVLAWAEVGRTSGLQGTLAGLSGAPALDAQGRVVGVTVAESPRRGKVYTTAPETVVATLRATNPRRPDYARGELVTIENYGRVADALRRELRVAQVICLPAEA